MFAVNSVFNTNNIQDKLISGKKAANAGPKRKTQKTAADPNAPKRPANPFFQYCQEQRTNVLESLIAQGFGEPSKQEVTKQLAINWNGLNPIDKKVENSYDLLIFKY